MATPRNPKDTSGAVTLRGWAAEAEAAANIAKALAPTPFIPDQLKRWENPEERNPANKVLDYNATVATVAAVLLSGQELGLDPMASLRSITVIKGTVALYAVAARALLMHAGHEIIVRESTSTRAVVMARRAGTDDWQTATWDLDRAKAAGLFPGHPEGNWRKQTKAMLVARASAEVSRWVAADALLGLPLMAEEVEDADREEAAAIAAYNAEADGESPPAAKVTATTKRKTTPKRAALPAAPPEEPPPARPPGPRPSKEQLAKLHAGLADLQITGREEGLGMVSVWAGRKVESTNDLTPDELDVVLTRIDALRAVGARRQEPGEEQSTDPDPPPPDADLEADPP